MPRKGPRETTQIKHFGISGLPGVAADYTSLCILSSTTPPSLHNLRLLAASVPLGRLGLSGVRTSSGSLRGLVLGLLAVLLLGGRWSRRAGAGESRDNGDEADKESNYTAGDLGHELDGLQRVLLSNGDEEVNLLLDVGDGVIGELEVEGRLGLGLRLVGLNEKLLGVMLGLPRLLGELLGVLDGVTDVDTVEHDVVLHGPDFEADLSRARLASTVGAAPG